MKNVGLKEREGKTKWSHEFSLCAIGEGEHEHSGWLQHSFYHHGSTFHGKMNACLMLSLKLKNIR